jgi:hypothetical protein
MTTTSLATNNYRLNNCLNFIEDVNSGNSNYYIFAGQPSQFLAGVAPSQLISGIPIMYDDDYQTTVDPYQSMLFGKLVTPADVNEVIGNYNWVSNTVYAKYDDSDPLLWSKQFYVVINASSYYHIFKCLNNHFGAPSTIPPNFSDVDATDSGYRTSDGYEWRYIYTTPSFDVAQFGSINYIPVTPNTSVQASTVDGAIDVVEVLSVGVGYSNYINGTFSVADVQLQGNSTLYSITNSASSVPHFYDGGVLYITADPNGNSAGQFQPILGYFVNATTKYVQLQAPFTAIPQNGAQYQINPGVAIVGDGYQTGNAAAWAVVNASSNTIDRIEMLNRGAGYSFTAASVLASNVVGLISPASIRPIYSPPGGHGFSPAMELFCNTACIGMFFEDNENFTIPAVNQYQRIGIIKNPLFANVQINMSNVVGGFIVGESVQDINDPRKLYGNVVSTGNSTLIATNGDFVNQLNINEFYYITDGIAFNQLLTVASVVNSSVFTTTTNCLSTSNNLFLYEANSYSNGVVTTYSPGVINLTNVQNPIQVGDFLIGGNSGAIGTVSATAMNGTQKTFGTFVQCFTYTVSALTGTFLSNELVFQGSLGNANALLFSANSGTILTTNQIGAFTTSTTIVGNSSGASATISAIYPPELDIGSGQILYLENFDAIIRSGSQQETFQIYLNF